MKEKKRYLLQGSETNFIVISKDRMKNARDNKSFLTLKEGHFSIKINLIDNTESKIDQHKIIQTISDIRKRIKIRNSTKSLIKNRLIDDDIINKKNEREEKTRVFGDKNNNSSFINQDNIINVNYFKKKKREENADDTKITKSKSKDISSILIAGDSKLSENDKYNNNDKYNMNEIEKHLIRSVNIKQVITQHNKTDKQKSIQQSDKAQISKADNESENITEFENKLKNAMKIKYDNCQTIKGDINEKEEYENELIDNDQNSITLFNKNKKNKNEEKGKIVFKPKQNIKNNQNIFFYEEKYNKSLDSNIKKRNNNAKNNKLHFTEISKDNKTGYSYTIFKDNNSEHRNLMSLFIPSIFKKKQNSEYEREEDKIDVESIPRKPLSIIKKGNRPFLQKSHPNSSNRELLKSVKNNNNDTNSNSFLQCIHLSCFICEKSYVLSKLYSAECKKHYLCQKCIKSYYEDYLEKKNNSKILKCPCAHCDKEMNYETIKNIIDDVHQQIYKSLISENGDVNENNKDSFCDNSIKKYSVRHVIDINKNMNLQFFKKTKELFCPKCFSPALCSKTNNYFIKCLNCSYKICKYCLKEYTNNHLDTKMDGYCKVYFRRDDDYIVGNNNIFYLYLIQLLFVIAMYVFSYTGTFLISYNILKKIFKLNDKRKNFFNITKKFFVILFSIILLIISSSLFIVCYPFFPVIIALCDY